MCQLKVLIENFVKYSKFINGNLELISSFSMLFQSFITWERAFSDKNESLVYRATGPQSLAFKIFHDKTIWYGYYSGDSFCLTQKP